MPIVHVGSEFLVNTTTGSSQLEPVVAGLANGRFVVAWADLSQSPDDPSEWAVRGQVFNADGSKAGEEFLVNTAINLTQNQPAITALSDGRFVVSWSDGSQTAGDTSFTAVRAQIFDVEGSPIGSEFVVPTTKTFDQIEPAVAGLNNGRFVVVWTDDSASGGDQDGGAIRAKIFAADGSPGNEFLVNTTVANTQYQPTVASLRDGRFVVAWTDWSGHEGDDSPPAIRAQVFDSNGGKLGAEFVVNSTTSGEQHNPSITGLLGGRFLASWIDDSAFDDGSHVVRARIFGFDGQPVAADFVLATTTDEDFTPRIAHFSSGTFAAAWVTYDATAEARLLQVRMFNADGSPSGDVVTVNTDPDWYIANFSIAQTADLRLVVTWEGANPIGGDDSGSSIHARILDARVTGISTAGTGNGDDFIGTQWTDYLNGSEGADRLDGAGGNDVLYAGPDNDLLFGGDGTDRVMLTGYRSDYQVSRLANGDIHIVDQREGSPDGTETVRDVELFQFVNGVVFTADELVGPANHAPVLANPLPDGTMSEDSSCDYMVMANTFSDPDNDPLWYTATLADGSALPAWLSFNAATLRFSGTPPKDWNGAIDIRVTAGDVQFSATDVFRLTVTPVNDAPTGISGGPLTVNEFAENGTMVGTLTAQDPDGGAFTYTLVDDAGGRFAIDNLGNLTVAAGGRLDYERSTAHTIVVRATDVGGLSIDQGFAVAVGDVLERPAEPPGEVPGVTILGTARKNWVDTLHTVAGQPMPTEGDDLIKGKGRADHLFGLGGDDGIRGGSGRDVIHGGDGDDTLKGGKGKDQLFGEAGADSFKFSVKLGQPADRIMDFVAADDTILLSRTIFSALDEGGALQASAFNAGGPVEADDAILYRKGKLLYDEDGKGGHDAVVFAKVVGAPALTEADFLVVA